MKITLDDNDLRQALTLWAALHPELNGKHFDVHIECDFRGARVSLVEVDPPPADS